MNNPEEWKPTKFDDFIGDGHRWGRMLDGIIKRSLSKEQAPAMKFLLYGPPGTGKTELAKAAANALTDSEHNIEIVSCRTLNASMVAHYRRQYYSGSIFGGWLVLILDEADTCPRDGQDALLTFLDELPPNRAVFATSNCDLGELTERVQTRFRPLEFKAPTAGDVSGLLQRFDGMSVKDADEIASSAGGNVRAALLDAQTHLDYQMFV